MDEIVSWKMTIVIDLDPFWTTNNLATFQQSPIETKLKYLPLTCFEMLQASEKTYPLGN